MRSIVKAPWHAIACLLFILVAGCSSGSTANTGSSALPNATSTVAPLSTSAGSVGEQLNAFSMSFPVRTPQDVRDRTLLLGGFLLGHPLQSSSFGVVESAIGGQSFAGRTHLSIPDYPGLTVGYDREGDESWAWNEAVMNDHSSTTDVGLTRATALFKATVAQLVDGGAVAAMGLDLSKFELSDVVEFSGRSDQPAPTQRISEYTFFAPRRINGITVHNAGVRVSVHRTGVLASINVAGPAILSTLAGAVEAPQGPSRTFTRKVAQSDIESRVQQENSTSTVRSLGLMYDAPSNAGLVAPLQAFLVSSNTVVDGKTVHGRAQYLYYSTEDAAAAPLVWPMPNPNAVGATQK
jgi:hypothetical protein